MYARVYVDAPDMYAHGAQQRVPGTLELESQMAVSNHVGEESATWAL